MVKVSKKKYKFLLGLFPRLIQAGAISEEGATKILSVVTPQSFDWRRLTRYALWVSIISLVISVTAVLRDEWIMQILKNLFLAHAAVKMGVFGFIAFICYTMGSIRRRRRPQNVYTNEALMFLGVLSTAGAIFSLGEWISSTSGHFSLLILLASISYGILGFFLNSGLILCFGILSLGGWLGAETGYMSEWGSYYLGLNYPLRFVIFGGAFLALTTLLRKSVAFKPFYNITRNMALLYLFLALWMLSIFGNYGDMSAWYEVKQYELFHWSLLFGAASAVSIYLGCKWDEAPYRGFGITFLFLNLYTRFFELFWNTLHMALFFFLLAVSLWYLASRSEKIWLSKTL